jgi:hypothetical protein
VGTTIGLHHAIFARNETLDLNRLALFVQVVQSGSFAETSRRMGMPPTTLSRQVAQLEDGLQARLLQRTTRKLTLTDAGCMLFDQCATQIEVLRSAAQALAGHNQAAVGGLGICLLPAARELLAGRPSQRRAGAGVAGCGQQRGQPVRGLSQPPPCPARSDGIRGDGGAAPRGLAGRDAGAGCAGRLRRPVMPAPGRLRAIRLE